MSKALDVANYFLFQAEEEAGDVISNLKLQKLLYYAQGLYLAQNGAALFPEKIEAWMHGPVVPAIYHHFKKYGDKGLPKPTACPKFSKSTKEFLNLIYRTYGQYSAWKLRNFTHDEPPWKNSPEGGVISHAALKSYFKTQLI